MKGTNVLRLNYETVMEALQEYLDKRMIQAPVIRAMNATNCSTWMGATESIPSYYGTMDITVQENGAFLEGKKT